MEEIPEFYTSQVVSRISSIHQQYLPFFAPASGYSLYQLANHNSGGDSLPNSFLFSSTSTFTQEAQAIASFCFFSQVQSGEERWLLYKYIQFMIYIVSTPEI